MTHDEVVKQITKLRQSLEKRLASAMAAEAKGEKLLSSAIAAFGKAHETARKQNKLVSTVKHQSLLDAIDKRQQELVRLRDNRREVEEEHRAYFKPWQSRT